MAVLVPLATCVSLCCRIFALHEWSAQSPAWQSPVLLRPALLHDHRGTLGASQQCGHVCGGAAGTGLAWHGMRGCCQRCRLSSGSSSPPHTPAAETRANRPRLKKGGLRVQVVPENLRSSAYAFDKGITGLLGALAAPLVRALAPPALMLRLFTQHHRTCCL